MLPVRPVLLAAVTLLVGGYALAVLGILLDTEHGWDLVVPLVAHTLATSAVAIACWRLCARAGRHAAPHRSPRARFGASPAPADVRAGARTRSHAA